MTISAGIACKKNKDVFSISLPNENSKMGARKSDDSENMIRPTPKRYLILFLFCLMVAIKAFQWTQIAARTRKVTPFYGVSNLAINTSSLLFMASSIVLSLPACHLIERIGLRNAVLVSSVGTVIKCFYGEQADSDLYLLLAVGQVMLTLREILILSMASRLASVWFPDHQVSSAFAMTILGNSLGMSLGFVVPQLMSESAVKDHEIGLRNMYNIFSGSALLSVGSLMANWFFFDEAPKFSPGAARLTQIRKERESKLSAHEQHNFKRQMRILMKRVAKLYTDNNYIMLTCSYGINVGLGFAIHTILNEILESLWPSDNILVRNCQLIIIGSGAVGAVLFGHVLDKSHRYRLTNILLTLAAALALLAFGCAMSVMHSRLALYLTSCFIGMFQIGLVVAGLELAVELTYPAPELVTTTMMNVSPLVFGWVTSYIGSYMIENYGVMYVKLFFVSLFSLSLVTLCCLRESLNRQIAVASENILHNYRVFMDQNQNFNNNRLSLRRVSPTRSLSNNDHIPWPEADEDCLLELACEHVCKFHGPE